MNGYSAGGWRQRQVRESLGVNEREGGQEASDAYEAFEQAIGEMGPVPALVWVARQFPELPASVFEDWLEMAKEV